MGLSPRLRGNGIDAHVLAFAHGSIPALAGERVEEPLSKSTP